MTGDAHLPARKLYDATPSDMNCSTGVIRRYGYAELMILDSTSLLRTLKRMRRYHMAMTAFGSRLDDVSRRALSTLLRPVGCGGKAGN